MTNVNNLQRERLIYKSESLLWGINHHLCIFVIFSIKINLRPNQPETQLQFLVKLLSSKLLLKLRHKTASIPCKSISNYYPNIVHERIQPYKKCGTFASCSKWQTIQQKKKKKRQQVQRIPVDTL